jgi:hypothetical protein
MSIIVNSLVPLTLDDLSRGSCTLACSPAWPANSSRPVERILGKRSSKRLLAADLLRTNEGVDCYGYSTIDVLC